MNNDKQIELHKEQNRVLTVIEEIKQQMEKLQEKGANVAGDLQEIRETFWNDVTVNLDEPDDVIETHTSLRQHAELFIKPENQPLANPTANANFY